MPELLGADVSEHFKSCVAYVDGTANGGSRGSGFFVDSDLVVTCAHVAGTGGDPVVVTVFGGASRTGTVEEFSPKENDDVAIVRLTAQVAEGQDPQPAMLLGRGATTTHVLAPGFGSYRGPDGTTVTGNYSNALLRVTPVVDLATNETTQLQLADGEVSPGLSGAAVIDYVTLEVAGIVRYQRPAASGLTEGSALPISVALGRFAVLASLAAHPPAAAFKWAVLTKNTSASAEILRTQIDLSIAGDPCKWGVGDGAAAPDPDLTVEAFGETVGRAVFKWLSGRRPKTQDELRWSGELLGIALLAGAGGRKVIAHHGYGAPFDLRLHFRGAVDLEDAPWELSLIRGTQQPLSTRQATTFARVDASGSVTRRAPTDSLGVLGIVSGAVKASSDPIPSAEPFERVRFEMKADRQNLENILRLTFADGSSPDVVHYAGFARTVQKPGGDEAQMLIRTTSEELFEPLSSLAQRCGAAGVRVLVIESRSPRPKVEWGPPPAPSAFTGFLRHGLQAIVLTQFAVSDLALRAFNSEFYRQVGRGMPVEDAVQSGRAMLQNYYGTQEPSGFAAFAVIVGPEGCGPLLKPREGDSAPTGKTSVDRRGGVDERLNKELF